MISDQVCYEILHLYKYIILVIGHFMGVSVVLKAKNKNCNFLFADKCLIISKINGLLYLHSFIHVQIIIRYHWVENFLTLLKPAISFSSIG